MRKFACLFSILLGVAAPLCAFAQISTSPQQNPVQYIVTPETPGPEQRVRIEAQGVGPFLGNATITWQQDGKVVSSGTGLSTFNFTTGGLGSQTTIKVTIDSSTVGTITRTFTFSPSVLNLLWEADTSTPPFYRGKPLYSGGARVTVAVFPEVSSGGNFISGKALSFQWSLNDNLIPTQSGLGRTVFTFQGDQLKSGEDVSVDAYLGNTKVGHGEATIPVSSPKVLLYQRDPLRGELLDAAMPAAVNLVGKEITVQAEPYYFSNISKNNGSVTYSWTINGEEAVGPDTSKGILTLRQTSSGQGTAVLGVAAQNTSSDQLVQAAQATIQMLFGQSPSKASSLFGL